MGISVSLSAGSTIPCPPLFIKEKESRVPAPQLSIVRE